MIAKAKLIPALSLLATVVACGGEPAKDPSTLGPDGTKLVAEAFDIEQVGTPDDAAQAYVRVLERVKAAEDPKSAAAATAAIDALVLRDSNWTRGILPAPGVVFRAKKNWAEDIAKTVQHAQNPTLRLLGSHALTAIYERRGNEELAEKSRTASGCVREALVLPPRDWAPSLGVAASSPVSSAPNTQVRFGQTGPWKTGLAPHVYSKRGCDIRPRSVHAPAGVRDIVFDRRIDKAGFVDVGIIARPPFALRAGGKDVIVTTVDGDTGMRAYVARIRTSVGRLRFVATIGGMSQDGVQLFVVPRVKSGALAVPTEADSATARVDDVRSFEAPEAKNDEERLTSSLAAIALGNARSAERMLMSAPRNPALSVVLARALFEANDLPAPVRSERVRGAIADLPESKWKDAWEPRWALASLAGDRKGSSENTFEVLAELDRVPLPSSAPARAMIDLLAIHAAASARLPLRAMDAWTRAKPMFEGTEAEYHVQSVLTQRAGSDLADFACKGTNSRNMAAFDCASALLGSGRYAEAMQDIARLRRLRGAPDLYLGIELRDALVHGDGKLAANLASRAFPGELPLSQLRDVDRLLGASGPAKTTPREFLAMPDVPEVLFHEGTENVFATYDAALARALEAGRAPDAGGGTRILDHDVRISVDASGLLHYVLFDVRKVTGTGDVESGAQVGGITLGASRASERVLRRRIHKPDGRILLPDRASNASQSHADLSQLEPGDVVEALYEGWATPAAHGALSFATSDLLPERTSVQRAAITVQYPSKLGARLYAHPLLGKAREQDDGVTITRSWHVEKQAPRRIEHGVPYAERSVGINWSVDSYANMARALQENLERALMPDAEVSAIVREATKNAKDDNERIANLVTLAGERIKQSAVGDLLPGFISGSASYGSTIRYALATHEGSRTSLIARGLMDANVKSDVVLAEHIPFPTVATFPAGPYRFTRPLIVAHLASGDVWIDADVPGAPLPAGHLSPEVEGRFALMPNGTIIRVPVGSNDERDEIDLRLSVDPKGNATGSLAVLLRGRTAQELSDAFTRLVGAEREAALRSVALAWVPSASVDSVQLSSREGSWEIALRAELTIAAYAQAEKTAKGIVWSVPGLMPLRSMIPKPYTSTLTSTYASKGGRENALVIQRAQKYRLRRRVDFPEGFVIARVPGPVSVKGPLSATRTTEVQTHTVNDEFTLALSTTTIDKASYDDFARDLRRIDEAFLAETRVTPAK